MTPEMSFHEDFGLRTEIDPMARVMVQHFCGVRDIIKVDDERVANIQHR